MARIEWAMCSSSGDAQFLRALDDFLAVHRAGEGLVLHLLLHRGHVHFEYAAVRLDVGDGGDEAGQLVAGEERLLQQATRAARRCKLACERMARRISSFTPRSASIGSPFMGWSGAAGWISQSKSCSRAVTDHFASSSPNLRAYAARTPPPPARACAVLGLGELAENFPRLLVPWSFLRSLLFFFAPFARNCL